jgi:predicted AlkP superfamily phosphohydrolase/phosphomutase
MGNNEQRVIIIGIDGVPYRLLEDLSDRGMMPHFKALRKQGVFTKLESSIPEISSVSWSSIITGRNPGEHGIYGFTDLIPGTYTMSFPNFRNIKQPAFWQQDDKTHVIINVPATYPVREINGFWVSGFVSLDFEKAVYPPSYVQTLQDMGYRVDVDSKKAHKSTRLFLKDLFDVHDKRMQLYRKLWTTMDWDVFMFVFTGSDRLEHFLWDAYEDPDHEYHQQFLEYFEKVDAAIGEINNHMDDSDALIMLSDHGMERIKTSVHLNTYLADNGYLNWGDQPDQKYNNIEAGTTAFALDPARIYLNKEDTYPRGSVAPDEEATAIEELTDLFYQLEKDGEKIIKKVYTKEDLYHGDHTDRAPDMVLLPHSGFSLSGSMRQRPLFATDDTIVGMHTQDDAFLYVKERQNSQILPSHPHVEDITSILHHLQGESL